LYRCYPVTGSGEPSLGDDYDLDQFLFCRKSHYSSISLKRKIAGCQCAVKALIKHSAEKTKKSRLITEARTKGPERDLFVIPATACRLSFSDGANPESSLFNPFFTSGLRLSPW
jgi:hypothetical protein